MKKSEFFIDEWGSKFWYLPSKGKLYRHRIDGPAAEWASGTKEWWVNGRRHRLDGPAIEWAHGIKFWFIDNKHLIGGEVESWLEENKIDLNTEEGQFAFFVRFS